MRQNIPSKIIFKGKYFSNKDINFENKQKQTKTPMNTWIYVMFWEGISYYMENMKTWNMRTFAMKTK